MAPTIKPRYWKKLILKYGRRRAPKSFHEVLDKQFVALATKTIAGALSRARRERRQTILERDIRVALDRQGIVVY